jgi:ankyrin repeat protein
LLHTHRGQPQRWGEITTQNQYEVLWQSVLRDDAVVLRRLLSESTVDVNVLNKGGQTPLALAIERRKTKAAAVLWALAGADSQGKEVTARTNALRKARLARWGRSGQTDPRRSENNKLHDAAGRGDTATVTQLLEAGTDNYCLQPFIYLTGCKNCAGEDVNAVVQAHHYMAAPLHFAVRGASSIDVPHTGIRPTVPNLRPNTQRHQMVIAQLLSANADVNILDERGHSALHRACTFGDVNIVQQLLDAHADVAMVDRNGWSALQHASTGGQMHLLPLLQGIGT